MKEKFLAFFEKIFATKKGKVIFSVCVSFLILILCCFFLLINWNRLFPPVSQPKETQDDPAATVPKTAEMLDPEIQNEHQGTIVSGENLQKLEGKLNGIDVSKWQGRIDWQRVKEAGIDFAIIRVGYRAENGVIYADENAAYNMQQAAKNSILLGAYFYSNAITLDEAREEAEWVLENVKGYPISFPIALDCEGFLSPSSRMSKLSAAERTDLAIAFFGKISSRGYDTMLYSPREELSAKNSWQLSRIESEARIWLAQFPAKTYPEIVSPDYSGKIDLWQYTDRGSVAGIEGDVDLVVSYYVPEFSPAKDPSVSQAEISAPDPDSYIYTQVNEEVTPKEEVNLRIAASTSAEIAATVKNGEVLTRTGIGSNGWSRLIYNGKTVYAISSYLTADLNFKAPPTPLPGFTAVNDSVTAKVEVNLRTLPSSEGEVVYTLKNGEYLTRTGIGDTGWSRLLYNGREVYCITSYLVTSDGIQQVVKQRFSAANDAVTAKEEVNLRAEPSTDSEVVYTLKNGEILTRTGIGDKGWSKLDYNGKEVYCITSYLSVQ